MPWPLAITHPCEYQEGKSDTTLSMRWNVRNKMKRAIVEGCEEPVSRHLEHGILQASNLSARETGDTRLELWSSRTSIASGIARLNAYDNRIDDSGPRRAGRIFGKKDDFPAIFLTPLGEHGLARFLALRGAIARAATCRPCFYRGFDSLVRRSDTDTSARQSVRAVRTHEPNAALSRRAASLLAASPC